MSNALPLPRAATRSGYRWFPWIFAGVMGVVVMVNIGLAWVATTSSTGLVTVHAYQEGTHYNDVLAQAAEQDALGWKSRVSAENGTISVRLTDAQGQALDGLDVRVWLTSPVTPDPDSATTALAAAADHSYSATLAPPHPGQWDVHVHAKRDGHNYYAAQRVLIR